MGERHTNHPPVVGFLVLYENLSFETLQTCSLSTRSAALLYGEPCLIKTQHTISRLPLVNVVLILQEKCQGVSLVDVVLVLQERCLALQARPFWWKLRLQVNWFTPRRGVIMLRWLRRSFLVSNKMMTSGSGWNSSLFTHHVGCELELFAIALSVCHLILTHFVCFLHVSWCLFTSTGNTGCCTFSRHPAVEKGAMWERSGDSLTKPKLQCTSLFHAHVGKYRSVQWRVLIMILFAANTAQPQNYSDSGSFCMLSILYIHVVILEQGKFEQNSTFFI